MLFALLAAAAWAAYILLSARTGRAIPGRRRAGDRDGRRRGRCCSRRGSSQGGADLLRPEVLATGAAIALASSVIPYSLELEALRRLPERVFGILMALEPCAAALAGLVVLGQALGAAELLGIAFVVVAGIGATAG